jgi:hypothetical protein
LSEQPPQKRLKTNTEEAEGQKHARYDNQSREESQTSRSVSSKQTPQKRLGRQYSQKQSQRKKYIGRRRWSDAEKQAINVGIQVHGNGNWAAIKEEQSVIFQYRTSGQIKDCFRTMKKKGEI